MSEIFVETALVSVFNKEGLEPIVKKLHALGTRFFSTGGTEKFLKDLQIPVLAVEDLTGYPSVFGGRVKTLHPKVFGGILFRREFESDVKEAQHYDIPAIDLVIVDLYPFEQTVASGGPPTEIIEKIDIGGVSLIRAAAKNFQNTWVVSSREQYSRVLQLLEQNGGKTTLEQRKTFAAHAFDITSHYDTAIFNYFNSEVKLPVFKQSIRSAKSLRYGENPHQKGNFFGNLEDLFDTLNGKELSYNNLVDIDACIALIDEFDENATAGKTTFAIIKHTNACGVATSNRSLDAYQKALACDPVSAFGGVIITNKPIDLETATALHTLFFEVLVAPEYETEAIQLLCEKKNRIILRRKPLKFPNNQFKTLLHGVIEQEKDLTLASTHQYQIVTEKKPSVVETNALHFANKVVKHTKSNTIVLAKEDVLLASGVGQTSRVDALKQAIEKANSFGFDLRGAVMASDAFFPFPDCVELAHKAGITAVLQPGGSVKDKDSIAYCNHAGMSMVFTGIRHFKH